MGTRADFYVGRGAGAEWIGSIAWDGYPGGVFGDADDELPLGLATETVFRHAVAGYLALRDDGTVPVDGWPWPWNDSNTTDYAYAFDDGAVWFTGLDGWRLVSDGEPDDDEYGNDCDDKRFEFPNMESRKAVTMGKRSGLMVFGS